MKKKTTLKQTIADHGIPWQTMADHENERKHEHTHERKHEYEHESEQTLAKQNVNPPTDTVQAWIDHKHKRKPTNRYLKRNNSELNLGSGVPVFSLVYSSFPTF
jgi:hypothetical protein